MEDSLKQILRVASCGYSHEIVDAAQQAIEFLDLQQGLLRDPAHDLREKCFKVIQLCLETKKNKFVSLALQSCHRILRDDRFHSNFEQEDDSKWLLGQLIKATSSFSSQVEDTQVDILKVFLNVACGNIWTMNGRLVIAVLSLCSEAFESGNAAVRTAAQAAASQTLRSFLAQLEEESSINPQVPGFTEIIPILQYICSKIDSSECSGRCEHGVLFLLECLLTILSSVPARVESNAHVQQVLWQKLAPALISVLGTPRVDKHITTRSDPDVGRGRGSGCLASAPSFTSLHARAVYSISIELVRIVGGVPSLRPMLESLFHRMLLYPAPAHRLDAIRATCELVRSPLRLIDIAAPMNTPAGLQSDLALIRLIMDSVEECRKGDISLLAGSVTCCSALIQALLELCDGACIPAAVVESVPRIWPNLHQCEYAGPRSYQSVSRLPPAYQDRIQKEREKRADRTGEESDSSGIGQRSDCSGDTEGPESLEQEVDSLVSELECNERVPRSLGLGIVELPISLGDSERQHARHFVGALHDLLDTLHPMWGNTQMDHALQAFASQYCQGVVKEQPITEWGIIVNADGIYLTTLSALLLDLRLYKSGYYSAQDQTPLLTEEEFVEDVQGSGVLVYLSGTWLREVYQAVVSSSLLHHHGYFTTNSNTHPLINLLLDIGGLGSRQHGSEMLWEIRRLSVASKTAVPAPEVAAGLRISRLILTCCWSSLLWVLASPLSLKPPRGKRRQQLLRDAVACSLQGLQGAAKLCSLLGAQDRCDLIVELLSSASCATLSPRRFLPTRDGPPRLTASAALSLELILQQGLELGSHCPACWPHVFRTVRAVRKLERAAFHASSRDVTVSPPGMGNDQPSQDDDEVDVYSFLQSSNGDQMVRTYLKSIGYVDLLSPAQTANVLTLLSYMSVELIMDAAYKLNLRGLEHFGRYLCAASRYQLFPPPPRRSNHHVNPPKWIHKFFSPSDDGQDPYLLDSVGELMVKSMRSNRPLAHIMRLWGVIGPHLTEAATHPDPAVSKKAVELIETCIDTHTKQSGELPYFHFNEALFKPFENLLCLELCENEVQDQIVSSICEFVEGGGGDVRSGWRALFGALRSVPTSATFLDVFRLFLDTKNPLVFCSAAVDCILCLVKHVRSDSEDNPQACLQFLQRCEDVLSAIWVMPQPLLFQAAHRIHISDGLLVELNPDAPTVVEFENIPHDLLTLPRFSYPGLEVSSSDTHLELDKLDRPSGVLRVWFLLLEGLYSAAISARSQLQPLLLDAVFADVLSLVQRDEPDFGIFVTNHILLPASQTWIRQCIAEEQTELAGLKQALGLLSELVVSCIKGCQHETHLQAELLIMLKQLMLLLLECAPCQPLASTTPSCFRHVVTHIGCIMTAGQWRVTVITLRKAFETTLIPLRQVLMAFAAGSHSYYGDYDQIKVAARLDSSARDVTQLKHLAQKVFLLDEQWEELTVSTGDPDETAHRSYTLLLRPVLDTASTQVVRVPVRALITGLLTHQSLLQIAAGLLLSGASRSLPSLIHVVLPIADRETDAGLPGLMAFMTAEEIIVLLDCLDLCYQASLQFDSRPGLKFLIQKVLGLERAANLYRLAGAAWAVQVVALFELCLHTIKKNNLTAEDFKNLRSNPTLTDLNVYVKRLQTSFEELCDTYIDIVLDQDGTHSAVDKNPEQPIMFLSACHDEQIGKIQTRKSESDAVQEDGSRLRPFMFSDFIDTVSASSTSDSEMEFADEDDERVDLEEFLGEQGAENDEVEDEPLNNNNMTQPDKGIVENDDEKIQNNNDKNGDRFERGNFSEDDNEVFTDEKIKGTVESTDDIVEETVESEKLTEEDVNKDLNEEKLEQSEGGESAEKSTEISAEAMSAVLEEYKKRKEENSKARRDLQSCSSVDKSESRAMRPQQIPDASSAPPEIEVQRKNSFLKDSEAHRRVWAEMLESVFHLLGQLTDEEFRLLLPLLFPGIRRLTAHAADPVLKQSVAELFTRVALVYGFASP